MKFGHVCQYSLGGCRPMELKDRKVNFGVKSKVFTALLQMYVVLSVASLCFSYRDKKELLADCP